MDLTKEIDVINFMQSSKTEQEWNDNCDKVLHANDDKYPLFWYTAIILSNLAQKTIKNSGIVIKSI